jgi:hypothetical protein
MMFISTPIRRLPPASCARADLHVVTSRANTGGAHAVQWSLPG